MPSIKLPSQGELRRLFDYDPETGSLIRRRKTGKGVTGKVLGSSTRERYLRVTLNQVQCWAHRIIWKWMTGEDLVLQIDHIDGNGLNNRWSNLRAVTPSQNQFNRRISPRGACWDKRLRKWRAQIGARANRRHIGVFETEAEALAARQKALGEVYSG